MGSAATANPFDLLIDEENEDPMLMKAAAVKKAPKSAPVVAAPAKADKSSAPPVSVNTEVRSDFGRGRGRGGEGKGGRGGRGEGGRGGRGGERYERSDRPPRVQEATEDGFEPAGSPRGNREGGRSAGRVAGRGRSGRAGGRGREGEGAVTDRPRREYERRDGTGRGHEAVKRGGAGRGNWGTEGEQAAEGAEASAEVEGGSPVEGASAAENEAPPVQAEEVVEEVDKTMSLEEYEKLAAEKRAGLNKAASNQTTVDFEVQFKGMSTIERPNVEDVNSFDLSRTKAQGIRKEKVSKVKDLVTDVGFSVEKVEERSSAGRGRGGDRYEGGRGEGRGRGGRGGDRERGEGRGGFEGRGRGGRGGEGRSSGRGGRGDAPRAAAPSLNVEDTSAFPTL